MLLRRHLGSHFEGGNKDSWAQASFEPSRQTRVGFWAEQRLE